jgi:GTP-binding protein
VDDFPGVTRDRNYAQITWEGKSFAFVDTGGYVSTDSSFIEKQAREQVLLALEEADIILFVADAKTGLHPEDTLLVDILRRTSKPIFYAVNKIDGPEQTRHLAEFYELGIDRLYPISSAHGFGIGELMTDLAELIPAPPEEVEETETNEIRISIVGRPNVGKSTLVNQILGTQRVIVSPIPGTTRDAVDTAFERHGQRFVLIDTAGIRRKGKTREKLEKISIIKALQSIERSHIAIILIDATEGVTDQDLHIAGYIQDRARGCVIGINKWDAIDKDPKRTKRFMEEVRDRFRFFPFAPILTFSAMTGKRVSKILPTVSEVFAQYNQRITTGIVNRALEQSLQRHEPPMVGGRRLKFYYATQASVRPPTFVLFCNYPDLVHFSYERFLTNQFREAFNLDKTPIRLLFRGRQKGAGEE